MKNTSKYPLWNLRNYSYKINKDNAIFKVFDGQVKLVSSGAGVTSRDLAYDSIETIGNYIKSIYSLN